jgi:uncharacterized protein (DUF362 family)
MSVPPFKPSSVGHVTIRQGGYTGVAESLQRALQAIGWSWAELPGDRIFIKLNCMSGEVAPGTCTSPWVVKAVLESLRTARPRAQVWIGDGDGYSTRQVEAYMKNWRVGEICKALDARPVNLSDLPTEVVRLSDTVGAVELPRLLLEMDCLLDLAVPKTHCMTGMTASLKNNWGLLPKTRYRYHPIVNDVIAGINAFFPNVALAVGDLTVTQDGPGPRCGVPRVCDTLLVSRDRVALDSACAAFMGLPLQGLAHILAAESKGVGRTQFEIVGDPWRPPADFRPARAEDHVLYALRDKLTRNKITQALFFGFSPVYFLIGKFARGYNKSWYHVAGKRAMRRVVQGTFYEEEYRNIL